MSAAEATLSARAPAKINLYLEVLGKRTDGYHEVINVMQTLELADEVTVTLRPRGEHDVTLAVTHEAPASPDRDVMPPMNDNLVVRAARLVLDATARHDVGVDLTIVKRIPAGGGLGGGSSDAATTLRLVHALLDAPLSDERMVALAASLGADVPFFLVGGTALCTGRGDDITCIAAPAPFDVSLVIPSWRLPTSRVYASLAARPWEGDRSDLATWQRRLDGADVDELEALFRNDLERAACLVVPDLTEILSLPSVHLSGSGSTLFTWSQKHADVMGRQMDLHRSTVRTRSTQC